MKRTNLFTAMLASLVPVPVVAFDSGVNGMTEANQYEAQHQTVATWAFKQFMSLQPGFRQTLDPIYPQPKGFNALDAQIADIIAQGEIEKAKVAELISEIDARQAEQNVEVVNVPTIEQTTINESSSIDENLTEFDSSFDGLGQSISEMTPKVEVVNDEGFLLDIDTSQSVDLPDLTIDPRNGGTYESEIKTVDDLLDLAQLIQDQVPAPIQSTGNDLYNQITGTEPPT